MRYLALDLGDKRTGIAIGDSVTGLITPADVLEVPIARANGAALLAAINAAAEDHLGPINARTPGGLVIGLPLNMDGTESPRSRMVRAFAERIAQDTRRAVHLHDERLTSAAADWTMARSGLTHKQKKQRRDGLAAAAVLNDFLAGLRSTHLTPPAPSSSWGRPSATPDDPRETAGPTVPKPSSDDPHTPPGNGTPTGES